MDNIKIKEIVLFFDAHVGRVVSINCNCDCALYLYKITVQQGLGVEKYDMTYEGIVDLAFEKYRKILNSYREDSSQMDTLEKSITDSKMKLQGFQGLLYTLDSFRTAKGIKDGEFK